MKHKAFTLLEILLVLAIICVLLSILIPRCNQELEPTPSVPVYLGSFQIIAKGNFRGYNWTEFKDSTTGTRIFHYREAMVVLPKD